MIGVAGLHVHMVAATLDSDMATQISMVIFLIQYLDAATHQNGSQQVAYFLSYPAHNMDERMEAISNSPFPSEGRKKQVKVY